MSSSEEDDVMETVADMDDDLFGDDDDVPIEKTRELSDRELDSGDDENRDDRAPRRDVEEVDYESGRDARVLDSTVWRHPLPQPIDGEFNTLRLPKFLGIEPRVFDPETFKPPVSDHHTDTKSANFSASAISASTMRYRRNSAGQLESNTVVYKWSDGSTTMSIGDQHYELQTKPLAPPKDSKTYQEVQDSHSYLATPSITSQLLVLVGHMTNQYTVRPNKDIEDDALEKLQRSLAAAARGNHKGDDKNGPELITNTQDPELQKKRAEIAEKERMRAQRRREAAAEKAGLTGDRRGGRGGLSVDDLEGRLGRRAPGSGRKAPKPRRHRPEYDSDDDLPRGGRHREDEYDKEDDFLASSDEDLEEGGDGEDEDEDDLLDDESERGAPKAKKQKLSKPEETSDADADAEADLDDDEAPGVPLASEPLTGRGRKRNIIEDDDDDDE